MKYSVEISIKEFPHDSSPAETRRVEVEANSAEQAMERFMARLLVTPKYPAPEGCEGMERETEIVYDFLDRDYTPNAEKTEIFWGDGTQFHAPRYQCGSFVSWTSYPDVEKNEGIASLIMRANGFLIQTTKKVFESGTEHRLVYRQLNTLQCPEAVKSVIQTLHDTERTELSERDIDILSPYKRYPV